MPELPEVETIRRGLRRTIVGKKIARVEVRLSKMIAFGPDTVSNIRKTSQARALEFVEILKGQRIIDIRRRAKVLMICLSRGYTLLVHLKMTGQLIFAKAGERKSIKAFNTEQSPRFTLPGKHTHVIVGFAGGSMLYFNDLRQFGYLRLVANHDMDRVKELSEFGPEPFAKDFNFDYFTGQMRRRPNLSIKQFITIPAVVAGVGNIYSDEILYCAKVRPERKAGSLKPAEKKELFKCVPRILKEGVVYHGSSVGDYFKVDGSEGTYGKRHRVYGRKGLPCRKCGTMITSVKLGGRTSSYCPKCQR